ARKSRSDPKPDPILWLDELNPETKTGLDTELVFRLETFQYKGIIPGVPKALAEWLRGRWPLTLLERVPGSREVLDFQVRGTRPVTLMAAYPRMLEPVLGKANGLDFMVHDLEHACKFFADAELNRLQRQFFRWLWKAETEGVLNPWPDDAVYAQRLDYLISDMNTHPVHGLRYLSANLVECVLRQEGKAVNDALSDQGEAVLAGQLHRLATCWGISAEARAALLTLVTDHSTVSDAQVLETELRAMA
ncbi:MAG: hypothetical protein ACR2HF_03920, partial [Methylococcaceae bacterium]